MREVVCPDCEKPRIVTYGQAWNIQKGHCSGRCRSCHGKQVNHDGLKLGRGWNKGLKGFGQWPKWHPKGELNPAWKGGTTPIGHMIRRSPEYATWRQSVMHRDRYTCQHCGKVGGKLHADHIKPFAKYPELRFDVDNGRVLCVPCHKKTPTYLNGSRWL